MKTRAPLALLVLAALAFGATTWTIRHNVLVAGRAMLGTQVEANAVTRSLSGSTAYDFASSTIECEDTPAMALTGALVGDACHVGFTNNVAGTGTGLNRAFDCYVSAAGFVKVRACPVGTVDDPPDAGFVFRLFSVQ